MRPSNGSPFKNHQRPPSPPVVITESVTFPSPGSRLITAPSLIPEIISGAALLLSSGGQSVDLAGRRAALFSAAGSHGSSGSGQTSRTFSVASGQSAATRLPVLSSQTGKRMPRMPSCSGSSSVGGSLPSSSQVERRRRQFSLPSGSDWPPGQQITPRPTLSGRGSRGRRASSIVERD